MDSQIRQLTVAELNDHLQDIVDGKTDHYTPEKGFGFDAELKFSDGCYSLRIHSVTAHGTHKQYSHLVHGMRFHLSHSATGRKNKKDTALARQEIKRIMDSGVITQQKVDMLCTPR